MAKMIVDDWSSHGMWFAEVGILRRRIHESAVFVPNEFVSKPENVVGSFGSGRQEHDTKARSRTLLAGIFPRSQYPVLVRLVPEDLGADTLLAVAVERLGGVVDLEDEIKHPASEGQLHVEVGLLPMLADGQRQSAIARGLEDSHSPLMTSNQRMDNRVGTHHCMPQSRRRDLSEAHSRRAIDSLRKGRPKPLLRQPVVPHHSPAEDRSWEATDQSGISERLHSLANSPFIAERVVAERDTHLADLHSCGRCEIEQPEHRKITISDNNILGHEWQVRYHANDHFPIAL